MMKKSKKTMKINATVAVDMGFWKIEKNAIPEGKEVGR